ncbi:HET domain-containing protein [Colletotrichum higginsianum IMI 349063]|uniref:HET domain-containing protein n=1 Tax=Colletotrichum higginsianum (strain IMI 349063) TaxID=759273 RepID=A0A1B7XTJ9_COLHI|nr:HET domain-containing protein [Colletotrichum higginsianum IMI 349063]OBR03080.1 HET domain-containing protein [Colletotrichum higginsianum IMI 349063]
MEVATVEYKFKAFQRVVLRLTRDGSPLTWTTEFLLNQKLFNPKDSVKTALAAGLSSYFVKWHIATTFRSACPFLTTDGRFGLGYCALDSGDSICVFSGLPTPLILRPCGLGWKIMGLAHVDGSLDGETWPENEDGLEQWEIV